MALKTLKDLEHRINLEAEALGLHRELVIETSPANVLGIELNPYAAELARVTVWIGEIQWMLTHGYALRRDPILAPLDHIECRDAVLESNPLDKGGRPSGRGDSTGAENPPNPPLTRGAIEPNWPAVDAIVGNPPFLGGSKKRGELGDAYFNTLNSVYQDRVPGGADLVTYWFEKARALIEAGKAQRAGLVATQAIRAGSNRKVLERIVATASIFESWSDEPWINNGAAVRVSLVCFGLPSPSGRGAGGEGAMLDGKPVTEIHADLTAGDALNLTQAKPLTENVNTAFKGAEKNGSFDIDGEIARQWLKLPNPNGHSNTEVVKPWKNGQDIAGRPSDKWVIDFGVSKPENEAALFEAPFAHALTHVKPERDKNNDANRKKYWWRFGRNGADMRLGIAGLSKYIVTPRVAKHRYFVWCDATVSPDSRLFVIAADSDVTFGILSSRIHEVWSLAQASMHGDGSEGGRPTYNAKSCFETFPFPADLTPRDMASPSPQPSPLMGVGAARIAAAAKRLNEQREMWLNPPEWVGWTRTPEEEKAGFPLRPVAKPGHEAELKKRTLTKLYNQRPAWLDHAHKELDTAVAAA